MAKESLLEVTWVEKTHTLEMLLGQEVVVSPLPAGLEASVYKLDSGAIRAVMKVWDKGSDADLGFQHRLLSALRHRAVSVSESYGWGLNVSGHKVLVTSYEGVPISSFSDESLTQLADILWSLHQVALDELDPALHKKYDFVRYFFPKLGEHRDIQDDLERLVGCAGIQQNCFIHGDFNGNNVLEQEGKIAVIDWTNAQCGDARYDLAWASFLIHIYVGADAASVFRRAYLSRSGHDPESIQMFEAIACLRWLLFERISDIPKSARTLAAVRVFIETHPSLRPAHGLRLRL
jgi:Ser/Thr protein kinase RdoA (MazF antagonist)